MLVDEIVLGRFDVVHTRRGVDHDHLCRSYFAHRARHDGRQAPALGCHDRTRIGRGDYCLVSDRVAHLAAHVPGGAVREPSDRNQWLTAAGTQEYSLARVHFEPLQPRSIRVERRSMTEPTQQGSVRVRLGGHQLPAAVGDLERRLSQKERVFRAVGVHASTTALRHDHFVIDCDVVAEKRKLEAVLSRRRTVAGRTVAALGCQNRHHVPRETHVHLAGLIPHLDLNGRFQIPEPSRDRRPPGRTPG